MRVLPERERAGARESRVNLVRRIHPLPFHGRSLPSQFRWHIRSRLKKRLVGNHRLFRLTKQKKSPQNSSSDYNYENTAYDPKVDANAVSRMFIQPILNFSKHRNVFLNLQVPIFYGIFSEFSTDAAKRREPLKAGPSRRPPSPCVRRSHRIGKITRNRHTLRLMRNQLIIHSV